MNNKLRLVGGAFVTGFYWALAGAIVALFIEAFVDPNGEIVDIWVGALGYPMFGGGVIFFTLLRLFEGRREFAEVSLLRAAALGAASAPILAAFFAMLVAASGGWNPGMEPSLQQMALAMSGVTLAFAVAALATGKMGRAMAAGIAGSGG